MKKQYRAILSVLLAVFLCCQLPVAAGETSKLNAESVDLSAYQEIIENRSANSKHFRLPDGTYTAVAYDASVHYEKDGEWVDIDNTLVEATLIGTPQTGEIKRNDELSAQEVQAIAQNEKSGSVYNTEYYENNANDFQVQLPKDIDSSTPVVINYEGHTVRFSVNNIDKTSSRLEQPLSEAQATQKLKKALVGVTDTESQEKIKKEHITSLQKNRSAVKYPSAQKDIDINYYVSGQSLKEDIVLHRVPTARSFSFDFTYAGLQAVLQPDNSVFFNDNTGRTIFIVPAPYMFDSDVGYSADIAVTVEPTEDGCRYTITPNREWLEDEKRVYPVTVDPQVYTTQNSSYIHDNGVQQSNPSTNYIAYDRMYVGSAVGRLEGRMYFKLTQWPTASLLNTHTITNATLRFYYYPQADWQTGYDMDIEVYTPAAVWNTNTITWNNQPTNVEQWITSLYIGDSRRKDNGYDNYDVTTWVKARYANPSGDKGITLRPYTVVNATNRVCYISSDYYTNSSLRPFITIEYTDRLFGLVGIPHPNHEHTHFMNNSIPSSYVKSRNTNIDGSTALGVLRASRAFISRSHGGKTSISCANNTYMTRADILALPSGALSHMQLVYYGACSTGEGGASAENLVNATYDRGARTVIGFTTEVDCGSTNTWTAEFMEQISNNHTIYYAMIQADNEAGTGGNTHLRLVRGLQEVTVS